MAAFEAMLSEYLKCRSPLSIPSVRESHFDQTKAVEGHAECTVDEAKQEEEDEYVYDLYYRDLQELGVGAAPDVGAL